MKSDGADSSHERKPVSQSNNHVTAELTFAEFFAGAGMARAGLGDGWRCVFANEIDRIKSVSYIANWGGEQLRVCDVADLKPSDLPPILAAWASPPCQDVSLAGDRGGLDGARSGAFWPWWRLMQGLRAPLLVIENVTGLLTSHEGRDFDAICDALTDVGYRFGTAIIDAALFVPQSRPRLFIVAADADVHIPAELIGGVPIAPFYPLALVAACKRQRSTLIWWSLPNPPKRNTTFADILEDEPKGVLWHSRAETDRLIGMMAPAHVAKVEAAKSSCKRMVGALYKRIRAGEDGIRRQRAEVRFDDIPGCLRMPTGGSSRQTIDRRRRHGAVATFVAARGSPANGLARGLPVPFQLQRSLRARGRRRSGSRRPPSCGTHSRADFASAKRSGGFRRTNRGAVT
jgi:DNA (cytosine-5)-methyltransferase 1